MLITDRYLVHFGPLHLFGLVRSTSIYFGPIWSTSVQLGPFSLLQSIQSKLVYLDHLLNCSLLQSIQSHLVHFVQFGLIRSLRFNLVHSVHLSLFNPIWSIWSISIYSTYLVYFKSLGSNSVYLLKNRKIQVWVKCIINYMININCNYMISFCYHNNLLKRIRI